MEAQNEAVLDELDVLACQILTEYWGINERPQRVVVGVNKQTWKVGERWLSSNFAYQADAVARRVQWCTRLIVSGG